MKLKLKFRPKIPLAGVAVVASSTALSTVAYILLSRYLGFTLVLFGFGLEPEILWILLSSLISATVAAGTLSYLRGRPVKRREEKGEVEDDRIDRILALVEGMRLDDIRKGIEEIKELLSERVEKVEEKGEAKEEKGEVKVAKLEKVEEEEDYSELYDLLVSIRDELGRAREKLTARKAFKP